MTTTTTSSTDAGASESAEIILLDESEVSTVVENCDNLINQQQNSQQQEDSPKFDQYLLDSITAAVSSSHSATSLTSSIGFPTSYNNSQNANNDPHEMPQLLNILNELLDGQDITTLANSGGNGENMQDMVDQEENYDDDSPRKDDPEEISRLIAQQRLEEISREEQQIQRRLDFLTRRLYKLAARSTGLHVSEELAGFLEHVARYTKKKEKEKQLKSSVTAKFPYLTANLQGASSTLINPELLKSPPVTSEPPLNLLSSPSTSTTVTATTTLNSNSNNETISQEQQQQKQHLQKQTIDQPLSYDSNITTNVIVMEGEGNVGEIVLEEKKVQNDEQPKPVPIHEMKSFLRRIDNISNLQSTILNKRGLAFKYFTKLSSNNLNQSSSLSLSSSKTNHHSDTSSSNFKVSAIPKFTDIDVDQIEQTSGLLMTEMRLIENQIDSDATASSTGGESADEMVSYNNQYQQPLSM